MLAERKTGRPVFPYGPVSKPHLELMCFGRLGKAISSCWIFIYLTIIPVKRG